MGRQEKGIGIPWDWLAELRSRSRGLTAQGGIVPRGEDAGGAVRRPRPGTGPRYSRAGEMRAATPERGQPPSRADGQIGHRLTEAGGVFLVGVVLAAVFQLAYQALRTVVALPRPAERTARWPWSRPAAPARPLEPDFVETRPIFTGGFAAFRYRPFVFYYAGAIFGVNGYFIYWTAQGWLALQLTNSAAGISLLFTVSAIPMLLLTLLGGAIADRANRKWVVICTRTGVAGVTALMGLATVAGVMTIPVFVMLTLVLGVLWAIDLPARQAMVADVVPAPVMGNAYAWQTVMQFVGATVGPIVAGFLVVRAGAGVTLIVGGLGHALVAVMLLAVRPTQRRSLSAEGMWRRTASGLKFIARNERVLLLVLLACIPMATVWGIQPLLPLVARDILGGTAATYGWLTGAIGVGSIAGAVFIATAHRVHAKGMMALLGSLVSGVAVAGFAYTQSLAPALLFLLVHGAALGVAQTVTASMVQVLTPADYQARMASVYMMTWNLTPVGILIFGGVAQAQGVPFGIWASGLSMVVVVSLLALTRPALRRIRSS